MANENLFQIERRFIDVVQPKQVCSIQGMTPEIVKQRLFEVQSEFADMSDIFYQQVEIEVNNGRKMPVLIISPRKFIGDLGMIYFIHGENWLIGDILTHRRLIHLLATEIPAVIVVPLYQLSSEWHFPYVLDDLYKGLQFVVRYRKDYGANNKRLAIMGNSFGGNLAAVLTFMAKENGFVPSIALQVLLYPVTATNFDTESYLAYADGPWLTRDAMQWFWDMYLPDKDKRYRKESSPLNAFVDELSCLPSALVITAENDVLRDEGEAYARRLDEAGVPVVSVRFNGTLHDFMMLNALEDTPATQAALALTVSQLRQFLYNRK